MVNAWGVARFLQTHSEVDQVNNDLHVSLWLHSTTHEAKAYVRLTIFGDKGRNDGMERALTGFVGIEMTFLQREQLASVLQNEAQSGRCHPRSHATVITLDKRHHIAFFIRHGQVDRIAIFQLTRLVAAGSTVWIDHRPAFFSVFFRY